jgi:hypothetical protein
VAKVDHLGIDCDLGCRIPVPSISAQRQRVDLLPEKFNPLLGTEHCCFLGADYRAVYLGFSVRNSALTPIT